MRCQEFQEWFERNLRGTVSGEWPREQYRRHLVGCPSCRLLLSLDEIGVAIAEVAESSPGTEGEAAATEAGLEGVHRKAARLRLIRGGAAVALLLALIGGWIAFRSSRTAPEPSPGSIAEKPEGPVEQVTPEAFARGLETDDFRLSSSYRVKSSGKLVFNYERRSPGANPYEFVKAAALSGFADAFPSAPSLIVLISEGDARPLRVMIHREKLAAVRDRLTGMSGVEACRQFQVLRDEEGRARPPDKERE